MVAWGPAEWRVAMVLEIIRSEWRIGSDCPIEEEWKMRHGCVGCRRGEGHLGRVGFFKEKGARVELVELRVNW